MRTASVEMPVRSSILALAPIYWASSPCLEAARAQLHSVHCALAALGHLRHAHFGC